MIKKIKRYMFMGAMVGMTRLASYQMRMQMKKQDLKKRQAEHKANLKEIWSRR